MRHCYSHPRAALTVDVVVLASEHDRLKILLVRRGAAPFKGRWALPGGFVEIHEELAEAAGRELLEETGLVAPRLRQLYTCDDPQRDPRGRTISVVHIAFLPRVLPPRAGDDAAEAAWFSLDRLPELAFDHAQILVRVRGHVRKAARFDAIAFELLPVRFTLGQLQRAYELLIGRELDKRNFRKKLLAAGILDELDEVEQGVARRAARLYRLDAKALRRRSDEGVAFDF